MTREGEERLLCDFAMHFLQCWLAHHFLSVPSWLCYSIAKTKKDFYQKFCETREIKMAVILPLWEWYSSCLVVGFFWSKSAIGLGFCSPCQGFQTLGQVWGAEGKWVHKGAYSVFSRGRYGQQRSALQCISSWPKIMTKFLIIIKFCLCVQFQITF